MRRSLSALLLGFSLFLGSLSWAGYTITHTVLDPSRSEELAGQLFNSPPVRSALVRLIADRIEGMLPAGIALPREQLEVVADRTLDDPAVEMMVRQGLVGAHQKALRGESTDTTLHATAMGTAARNSLIGERPELAPLIPQAPAIQVQLPTAGLSYIGRLREALVQGTLMFGLLGAAGAIFALVMARDRSMVLRRMAFWAFGTSAFWLLVSFGIPMAANLLSPTSGTVATAMATVMFGAMIPGAVTLAAVGGALLAGSFLWGQFERRRGSHMVGHPVRQGFAPSR